MCAPQRMCRPAAFHYLFTLLLVLACLTLCRDAAKAQRITSAPAPLSRVHKLHLQFPDAQPRPLSMVSGDFDEDGIQDLVIGYGVQDGGSILVLHGNGDAIAPQTHESWLAAGMHEYSEPFLQRRRPVHVKKEPDLMVSADVNGDGNLDVVYASKGGSEVQVMFGNGDGTFQPNPALITVSGGITALAAYRPGAPVLGEAIIVGYESSRGPRLSIVSDSAKGLAVNATYALPGIPTKFAVANLDGDFIPDTAIVASGELLVLHGANAIRGGGRLEVLPVGSVGSVTTGEFLFDRHALLQLSVVTSRGDVIILAHQGFDPTPYTPQEIAAIRRQSGHPQPPSQQTENYGNQPWIEVESHSGVTPNSSGSSTPLLVRSRMSGSGGDDLIVLNSSGQETVISHPTVIPQRTSAAGVSRVFRSAMTQPDIVSPQSQPATSRVTTNNLASDDLVAALSMRVNADGRPGLVVLNASDPSPEVTDPAPDRTFYVNTTADNTGTTTDPDDGTWCTVNAPPPGADACTLRDAITFVNDDASDNISGGTSDTIMLPSGTYDLTWQAGTVDVNGNYLTHLELLGPVTIVGDTSGSGTIIDAQTNDVIFTINPGPFGSFNPSGVSYVFDTTIENVTMQNGLNQNNPNPTLTNENGYPLANYVGGGINWDAYGMGNLTITNSTVQNCTAEWGPGGGIWLENSIGGTGVATLTGGSVSNNSTSEQGGGIYVAYPPTGLTVTNTTVSGDKASISINSDDPAGSDGNDAGGGLYLSSRTPYNSTPQATLSGMTISSNSADGPGGGISTTTGLELSTSVVSSNSSTYSTAPGNTFDGGGLWGEVATPEVAPTITSTNFLSNSAYTAGGAIAVGADYTTADGNILQAGLNRIFGNTSTNGVSGLALGQTGGTAVGEAIATDNWWGCNDGPMTNGDGCDQAALYQNGSSSGTLTVSPWAAFGLSANPTSIGLGNSASLSITLDTDFSGNPISGAFPAVATNYPYTFNVTGVTADSIPNGTFSTAGTGTATLTPTSVGNGIVSATFDNQTDSVSFTVSTAATLQLNVSPSANFFYGQPPTLVTVQFNPSDATGISTGDFQVLVDGSVSSSYTLTSAGGNLFQITGPFNLLPPGSHTLEVEFSGNAFYSAANTSTTLTVASGEVTIGYTLTPTNPIQGQGGTVNVTVAGVGSGVTPTGSLSYAFDGGTPTSVPLSGGSAVINIPTIISTGNHNLILTYEGDANYASSSAPASFTIFGTSRTIFASLTTTSATIDVLGLGFTAPSGQLAFNDVTTSSPVTANVTLNTASAAPTLLPQTTMSTGTNTLPVWTTLTDVNGDGKLDLITSLYSTDSVTVQLGNGDGTFQTATTTLIASGFGPAEVHAVSLRKNGVVDLIIGSFNTNQIAVLLGNGNGTFQSPVLYTVGSSTNTTTSLTTGDFNDDGNLDVAVANKGDNTISILLGDGIGNLAGSGSPINVGLDPEAIRAGDFNGDGYSDLAVANHHDGTVTILLNNQNGTFAASTISVGSGADSGPQALAINGSGSSLLLAVANSYDNTISVMQSNGNGTFGTQTIVPVGNWPDDLSFTDFNNDGIPDLVVVNYNDGTVNMVLGNTSGGYSVTGTFAVGTGPYSAAVGDVDLDGTPDLLVSNCFSNNAGELLSGTQISVPYSGLSLNAAHTFNAVYTPDASSKYGASTSPNVTIP